MPAFLRFFVSWPNKSIPKETAFLILQLRKPSHLSCRTMVKGRTLRKDLMKFILVSVRLSLPYWSPVPVLDLNLLLSQKLAAPSFCSDVFSMSICDKQLIPPFISWKSWSGLRTLSSPLNYAINKRYVPWLLFWDSDPELFLHSGSWTQ